MENVKENVLLQSYTILFGQNDLRSNLIIDDGPKMIKDGHNIYVYVDFSLRILWAVSHIWVQHA